MTNLASLTKFQTTSANSDLQTTATTSSSVEQMPHLTVLLVLLERRKKKPANAVSDSIRLGFVR
jgi:hypothetical protein